MRPDPAPLFSNLVLFFYDSKCLKSIKISSYDVARKSDNVFRSIVDLIAISTLQDFLVKVALQYQKCFL